MVNLTIIRKSQKPIEIFRRPSQSKSDYYFVIAPNEIGRYLVSAFVSDFDSTQFNTLVSTFNHPMTFGEAIDYCMDFSL